MEAADFINKCLQRKPANRLGLNGPNEVKQHVWLRDVEWQTIIEMRYSPTFLPCKQKLYSFYRTKAATNNSIARKATDS